MGYTETGELCDESIMKDGIFAIDWKEGHSCVASDVYRRLIGAVEWDRTVKRALSPARKGAEDGGEVMLVRDVDVDGNIRIETGIFLGGSVLANELIAIFRKL